MQSKFDFERSHTKAGAPDTSFEAAEHAKRSAVTDRAKVYVCLQIFGPSTCEEVADKICMPLLRVRPRMSDLRNAGIVEDSGLRRKNQTGKNVVVWRIK